MKICPVCKAEIEDGVKVCPICEAVLEEEAQAEPEKAPKKAFSQIVDEIWFKIRNPEDNTEDMDKEDADKNRVLALLSYIGILFLIPLIAGKNSKYTRYHTNQGIILCLYWLATMVVGSVVTVVLGATIILAPIAGIIGTLLSISTLLYMIFGIYNAATAKAKKLPFIGKFDILK